MKNLHNAKMKTAVIVAIVLALNLFTLGCEASLTQASNEESLDAYLEDIISQDAELCPSVSVMVIDQGDVVYQKSFGYANIETQEKATPASNYRLAALTKPFTAMCILMLKERGLLDYDTKACDILEDFPEYGKDITIGQLMNNTSGLQEFYDYKYLLDRRVDEKNQVLDADAYAIIKQLDMTYFPPGTQYNDADMEFIVLGLIIEEVSGMNLSDFMRENIFEPLEMNDTVLYDKTLGMEVPNRAYGTEFDGSKYITNDQSYSSATRGDGGVYSSLEDLYKWDQALYNDILVSEDTMEEAYTTNETQNQLWADYGTNCGWCFANVSDEKSEMAVSGGTQGFTSQYIRIPEQKRAIVVLSNKNDDELVYSLFQKINDTYGFGLIL